MGVGAGALREGLVRVILVVDDDELERNLVARTLTRDGFETVCVSDGDAALEVLTETRPDIVLLDVLMPGRDGLDVLDQIRARPDLAGMPVILLTGKAGSQDVVAGLGHGAQDYLTKPFAPAELIARVRAALRTVDLIHRLEQRTLELDRYAMTAAHDLKSPLSAIRGTAELMRRRWDRMTDEQREELFLTITTSADRSARMIEDLLTLARFDQEGSTDAMTQDPRGLATDVVSSLQVQAGDRVSVEGTWVAVAAVDADLRAALTNLLGNASHYGRGADGTLQVTITGSVVGSTMVIDVRDMGPGIPEAERMKIFDPFYGVEGSRRINPSSTGIGLAIVKRAADRWRGSVTCLAGDPGTIFRLVVPAT